MVAVPRTAERIAAPSDVKPCLVTSDKAEEEDDDDDDVGGKSMPIDVQERSDSLRAYMPVGT